MGHGIAYLLAAGGPRRARLRAVGGVCAPRCRSGCRSIVRSARRRLRRCSTASRRTIRWPPAMKDAAFVFEAAPEKLPLKQQIFAELESADRARRPSSPATARPFPSTEIGRNLKHRERVVGTHFWNPPHLVPLVEVIQNEWTSDDDRAHDHRPAARRRPRAGACAPRHPGLRRQPAAARAEARGDRAGRGRRLRRRDHRHRGQGGFGARMAVLGPMEQSDLVGLDLTLDIQNVLVADLDRTRPSPTSVPARTRSRPASSACDRRGLPHAGRRSRPTRCASGCGNYLAEQAKAAKKK